MSCGEGDGVGGRLVGLLDGDLIDLVDGEDEGSREGSMVDLLAKGVSEARSRDGSSEGLRDGVAEGLRFRLLEGESQSEGALEGLRDGFSVGMIHSPKHTVISA